MRSQATTLPLKPPPLPDVAPRAAARPLAGPAPPAAEKRAPAWVAAVALGAIVALSLLLVVIVANRPSGLSPTTHNNFYPGWMAGPLGGLWPGLTRDGNTLRYLFTAIVVAMYVGYLLLLRHVNRLDARWVIAGIV